MPREGVNEMYVLNPMYQRGRVRKSWVWKNWAWVALKGNVYISGVCANLIGHIPAAAMFSATVTLKLFAWRVHQKGRGVGEQRD